MTYTFAFARYEHTLTACSHQVKTNAKTKKIKEQSEEIKENNSSIKENFRFRICFRLLWTDSKIDIA